VDRSQIQADLVFYNTETEQKQCGGSLAKAMMMLSPPFVTAAAGHGRRRRKPPPAASAAGRQHCAPCARCDAASSSENSDSEVISCSRWHPSIEQGSLRTGYLS
jgi:hypothetical protein